MKRQAIGVRSNEEVHTEEKENKRIKLLQNEASEGVFEMDCTEDKSVMGTLNKNSHCHNHGDESPSFSKNGLSDDHRVPDVLDEKNDSIGESKIIKENGSLATDTLSQAEANCYGSFEEVVVQATSSESGISSESYHSNALENSELHLPENQLPEERESVPPVLNCEVQNSESTDSFQSEVFEANHSIPELDNEVTEPYSSQDQSNDTEEKSSDESVMQKNIDLDNLMMSHLKVTELSGHSDTIYSVAADEDLVLSASVDTTVRVWSVDRQSIVSTFSGHSDCVTCLYLLNQNQSKALKKKMSLTKVARIAITGSYDCHIKLWSVLEGKELASVYTFNGITCVGYLESECLVVIGTEGGKLELWDISSSKAVISVLAHEDAVSGIKVKDDYIYSVSIDGTVKVWVYEDDDIYPVYTRKRKEASPYKKEFNPTRWKTVAVSDNVIYLGEDASYIKVLDWRAGRLRAFRNQNENYGICESVMAEGNMLLTSYYDADSDSPSGGINVWKLPEMTYVCTLSGAILDIYGIAAVPRENGLRIVSGGHGLHVWDFDFSKPPSNSQDEYCVRELENLGLEIDEKNSCAKADALNKSKPSIPAENEPSKQWCNVM